jgi:hypothetical protein
LIRSVFSIDPSTLSEEQFIQLAAEALFVKDFDRKQQETALMKIITAMFPKTE